jgi:hypothetical protein
MVKQATSFICKPLISALMTGIDERFHYLFGDSEAIAAAILHPKFRNSWTDDQKTIQKGLQLTKDLSTTAINASPSSDSESIDDDDEAAFFSRYNPHRLTMMSWSSISSVNQKKCAALQLGQL